MSIISADFSHQTRKFIRKSVRISIKGADFRTKRASSCLKTSKVVEKFGKMYRNG